MSMIKSNYQIDLNDLTHINGSLVIDANNNYNKVSIANNLPNSVSMSLIPNQNHLNAAPMNVINGIASANGSSVLVTGAANTGAINGHLNGSPLNGTSSAASVNVITNGEHLWRLEYESLGIFRFLELLFIS